jgi:hypothetical protein
MTLPKDSLINKAFKRDQLLTCFCLLICSLIHLLVFIRVMALRPHLFQLHLFLARRILEMVHMFLHNRILSHRQILNFSMHEVLIRDISLISNHASQSGLIFIAVQGAVDHHQIHQVIPVVSQTFQAIQVFQTCRDL